MDRSRGAARRAGRRPGRGRQRRPAERRPALRGRLRARRGVGCGDGGIARRGAPGRRGDYPLKVAVIHSAGDSGPLASVFGRPQQYADRLVSEFPRHNPEATGLRILVAMPAGAAVAGPGVEGAERRAACTTRVSRNATPTQLVDAARTTVERMADAAGHPIGGGGGAAHGAIAAVLIGALVLAAALAGVAARRRAGD